MNTDQHVEESLNKVRDIFNQVVLKIDSLQVGEKITANKLAEQIAVGFGMTGPQIYTVIKLLINPSYPGVEIKTGREGGIYKK